MSKRGRDGVKGARAASDHATRARALEARGELEAAKRAWRDAAEDESASASARFAALNNLAALEARLDEPDAAIADLEAALALPVASIATHERAAALSNLGALALRRGRIERAISLLRDATTLAPALANAHTNLGNALAARGEIDEALASLAEAVALAPSDPVVHDNLLVHLAYSATVSRAETLVALRRYGAMASARAAREGLSPVVRAEPDPSGRLRLGFVSADLRRHSVAFFVEPLLEGLDRDRVEVVLFSNVARPDEVTARLRALADGWEDVSRLSDREAHERVRARRIEVLVDLSGHTAGNRLGLFALRAAPVQLSYLGYPDVTGLPTIDARLTDAIADPPARGDEEGVERLLRMDGGFLVYRPPTPCPDPAPVPSAAGAPITFGSFNASKKTSDAVLAAWSRILAAVPGARLVLKDAALADEGSRELVRARLARHGIALDRVTLRGPTPDLASHLAAYAELDVALDTFPYHGTTTTCDALWMGVPVVSWAGATHASRVGASLLARVGLSELVATDAEQLVRVASELARDTARLASLRATLRERAAALTDAKAVARAFEACVREALGRRTSTNEGTLPDRDAVWRSGRDGNRVASPRALSQMTAYVLEEQGDWFEAELPFVRSLLAPGDRALDVGANHGLYALAMARAVGPEGRVIAVEPAAVIAERVRASARENSLGSLAVRRAAVGDRVGEAWLATGASSELSSLAEGAAPGTECVPITTLDALVREEQLEPVAFVKLDVEGHEIPALEGARTLLARDEPLLLLEHHHAGVVNEGLLAWLDASGHALLRLVPGLGLLAPLVGPPARDPFLLNVFAATPARAALLEARGLCATARASDDEIPETRPWSEVLTMPHVARLGDQRSFGARDEGQAQHRLAIELWGLAIDARVSPRARVTALSYAVELAVASIAAGGARPDVGRLLTAARLSAMDGRRAFAVELLETAIVLLERNQASLAEPFLPPSARFDTIDPEARLGPFLLASAIEAREQLRAFSSYFVAQEPKTLGSLEALVKLGFADESTERRLSLVRRVRR
jgi:FkbM family methyltransferase